MMQKNRKIPISVLMKSTAESADHWSEYELVLKFTLVLAKVNKSLEYCYWLSFTPNKFGLFETKNATYKRGIGQLKYCTYLQGKFSEVRIKVFQWSVL